jgi:hypothetical protein
MNKTAKTYTTNIGSVSEDDSSLYVHIYVTCPDGSEWRFTVSLNKANNCNPEERIAFSATDRDEFVTATTCPDIVKLLFEERLEEAGALLRATHAQRIKAKEHAGEMLTALKRVYACLRDRLYKPEDHDLRDIRDYVKLTLNAIEGKEAK